MSFMSVGLTHFGSQYDWLITVYYLYILRPMNIFEKIIEIKKKAKMFIIYITSTLMSFCFVFLMCHDFLVDMNERI